MRIGIDIDDVLADLNQGLNQFLHTNYGVKIEREHWTTFMLHDLLGWTREQGDAAISAFNASSYLRNLAPIAGAQTSILQLRKKHELVLITARAEENHQETQGFLDEHYGQVFAGLHYTNHARNNGTEISKSVVCIREKIEVLIDDGLHNAEDCAEKAQIPVYLLDTPWNQTSALHPLITRVYSWKEIIERIETAKLTVGAN